MKHEVHILSAGRLLSALPKRSVSAVILDPPALFGVKDQGNPDIDDMISELIDLAEKVNRVLTTGGVAIFMGPPRLMSAWELAAGWQNMRLVAEITVLWRRNATGSVSLPIRWYVNPGRRFGSPSVTSVSSNVVVCDGVDYLHRLAPMQRPVELFNYLVSLLTSRGVIVDPFCGTGSALVAAEMCGREWIGGDVNEDQALIARKRLQNVEIEEADLGPLFLWNAGELERVEG